MSGGEELSDLWGEINENDNSNDTELYNDAAVEQAQRDFAKSEGKENIIDDEEKIKRRAKIRGFDTDDDEEMDSKWDKFKIN